MVNWWNKGTATSTNFAKVCEQSKFVCTTRACSFDTFGSKNKRRAEASGAADIETAMRLIERAKIGQLGARVKRELTNSFWWDLVERPVGIGSARDKVKESVPEAAAVSIMFNH